MARIVEQVDGDCTWFLAYDEHGNFLGAAKTIVKDGQFILDGISVLPKHQGGGVGSELIKRVKMQCSTLGLKKKVFGQFEPDPGREDDLRRFYLNNGFDERGNFKD